jgi:hypothetical protein
MYLLCISYKVKLICATMIVKPAKPNAGKSRGYLEDGHVFFLFVRVVNR